jgi:hypothetical protein
MTEILAATNFSLGEPGLELPTRMVLHKTKCRVGHPYASHLETKEGNMFHCDYYETIEIGLIEFMRRMERHNQLFKKGNVSHIPGLEFVRYQRDGV